MRMFYELSVDTRATVIAVVLAAACVANEKK